MRTAGAIEAFIAGVGDADYYICGPTPFMDTAEKVLLGAGVPADRLRLERFEIPEIPIAASDVAASENDAPLTEKVTIELDRQMTTVRYREGETLLQTARSAGLRAPSSCETGSCGTCMARLTEGSARMLNNDALDDDEVAQGWVLTCQSLPIGQSVRVVYE
jgi:3-ketosteroid 9alpha-monooxygenase subunit B